MRATNSSSTFGATQLIAATPVAAHVIRTQDGHRFMRIYVDMTYPDPATMKYGELFTVADTGIYDETNHVIVHHFLHPFQMQFGEGHRGYFPVHGCDFPVSFAGK